MLRSLDWEILRRSRACDILVKALIVSWGVLVVRMETKAYFTCDLDCYKGDTVPEK